MTRRGRGRAYRTLTMCKPCNGFGGHVELGEFFACEKCKGLGEL